MSKVAAAVIASEAGLISRRRPGEGLSVSQELKTLRAQLGLSQREFSEKFGISLPSIHTWESPAKAGNPDLSARLLIDMIWTDAEAVAQIVRKTKLRKLEQDAFVDA